MAEDLAALEGQIAKLREARAMGVRKVQYADGRGHEYASLDEMGRLIAELERRAARLSGTPPVRTVLLHSAKGV